MLLPLVVLALQPKGVISADKAQRYVNNCRSSGKKYTVHCCECGPAIEPIQQGELWELAYARAIAALQQVPEAVVAVGLQGNTIRISLGTQSAIVRAAAAALVMRNHLDNPHLAMATMGKWDDTVARVVAGLLQQWSNREFGIQTTSILDQMTKRAVGL